MRLTERRLIAALPSNWPVTVHELAARVFDTDVPTRAQVESVRRAAKRLAAEHHAILNYRTEDDRRQLTVRAPYMTSTGEPLEAWEHQCYECQRPFRSRRIDAVYCSNACRQQAYRKRLREIADVKAGQRAPFSYRTRGDKRALVSQTGKEIEEQATH